ncbi:Hypothetical protein BN2458_PEG0235 [Helicobacter typhlonius]|uniref:Uncharacterized protein n=1 Tax=Helicobacter typhlonius TaxID=76936 RepID=A0A099UE14_9HELI|nr:Hypothetical protein BN2458_PEG0235 [Helicobacter typhlonius]HCD73698.1 hypothetical protein [Helicobacter sp.]
MRKYYILWDRRFYKQDFNAQTFFHIGGLIFFIFNYKSISLVDLKHIKLPLICFAIVLLFGFCTLFDTITISQKINSHILGWFVIFFVVFFLCNANIAKNFISCFYYLH